MQWPTWRPVPDDLADEQVLMCPDIMSTGLSGAERGRIRIGDTVAVFAQGPTGLCATIGPSVRGNAHVHGGRRGRTLRDVASARRRFAIDDHEQDPVEHIRRATGGRGVDVAIEALGTQGTFEYRRDLPPFDTISGAHLC